ncbi:kinase-associated lipoprotein B [Bacillus testis]|uniref:kinase-associated lipoprotein B n=1 Tax=Bacillus testis TaxID=1622072 RepID=UPI00067E66AF|nr:kinase-associated lipoprotein B [Bacillus testis]
MSELQVGSTVTVLNKTGKYIGEITAVTEQSYLVRIAAVLKHPMQGDLHNPKQVDVAMFHIRKALAYREQINAPKNLVKPYDGEVPDYKESLKAAFEQLKDSLQEGNDEWTAYSKAAAAELEKDYFK